jgi:hypothetical protein
LTSRHRRWWRGRWAAVERRLGWAGLPTLRRRLVQLLLAVAGRCGAVAPALGVHGCRPLLFGGGLRLLAPGWVGLWLRFGVVLRHCVVAGSAGGFVAGGCCSAVVRAAGLARAARLAAARWWLVPAGWRCVCRSLLFGGGLRGCAEAGSAGAWVCCVAGGCCSAVVRATTLARAALCTAVWWWLAPAGQHCGWNCHGLGLHCT